MIFFLLAFVAATQPRPRQETGDTPERKRFEPAALGTGTPVRRVPVHLPPVDVAGGNVVEGRRLEAEGTPVRSVRQRLGHLPPLLPVLSSPRQCLLRLFVQPNATISATFGQQPAEAFQLFLPAPSAQPLIVEAVGNFSVPSRCISVCSRTM